MSAPLRCRVLGHVWDYTGDWDFGSRGRGREQWPYRCRRCRQTPRVTQALIPPPKRMK